MEKSNICIVGAGPAGAIAALFLAKMGIACTLIDKAKFPRDKICGDGISGWVLWVLHQLDPAILARLNEQDFLNHSYGIRVIAPNQKYLDLPFMENSGSLEGFPPGYICKREHFDNFLIQEIKNRSSINLLENTEISSWNKTVDGVTLQTTDGRILSSDLVIFANGANSQFMKDPGGIVKDKKSSMLGIKTYFQGINGTHDNNYVELHFLKNILPGYLWIFPLPNGEANVGVGLDRYTISRKKVNLKKVLFDSIENLPYLRSRFNNAKQISPVQAYGLPLWDKRRAISGDRYMLAGDSASLIDPITGEGIGHAALSGMYAAKQAERALATKDYSAGSMSRYDDELFLKIGKELKISKKIPQFIKHAWLFNTVINRATSSNSLKEKLERAMTDLEVRKELKEPSLYLKMLMGIN